MARRPVGPPAAIYRTRQGNFTARRERARIGAGSACDLDGSPVYFDRGNGAGFEMAYASKMVEAFHRPPGRAGFFARAQQTRAKRA